MERHNPYSTTRPEAGATGARRDLPAEAHNHLVEGRPERAANLYYQATEMALEATRALSAYHQDMWAVKAATEARELAAKCREAAENVRLGHWMWRDCAGYVEHADLWAAEATAIADHCVEENAHTWG